MGILWQTSGWQAPAVTAHTPGHFQVNATLSPCWTIQHMMDSPKQHCDFIKPYHMFKCAAGWTGPACAIDTDCTVHRATSMKLSLGVVLLIKCRAHMPHFLPERHLTPMMYRQGSKLTSVAIFMTLSDSRALPMHPVAIGPPPMRLPFSG